MSFTSQGYFAAQESKVQLEGIDFIELYVGNALQAAHFYRTVFGFTPIASLGLETQVRDHVSIAMQQGQVYLVLTASLSANSPIAEHVRLHGDGVKDIAFRVANAAVAFQRAVQWGARPVKEGKRQSQLVSIGELTARGWTDRAIADELEGYISKTARFGERLLTKDTIAAIRRSYFPRETDRQALRDYPGVASATCPTT